MAPQRILLMSCGSYNPPTNMHLRMFEIARDHLHRIGKYEVLGGIISPVNDAYGKKDLASSKNRTAMLNLALESSDWIRPSTWEMRQNTWTRTLVSLTHHQNTLNCFLTGSHGSCECLDNENTDWIPESIKEFNEPFSVEIKLLCGADLLESFATPVWQEEDIDQIVKQFGLVVVTREGCDPNKFIYHSDILSKHMHNIIVVTEWIPNEVSSTRIRRALKRGESVKYLMHDSVIDFIYKNRIYDAKPTSKTKSDLSYDTNDYLPKSSDTILTQSPSNVAITPTSPVDIPANLSASIIEMNLENSSRIDELTSSCLDVDKLESIKPICSSDNSNQVPTSPENAKLENPTDSSTNVNSQPHLDDDKVKTNSSRVDSTNEMIGNDQHCLKTESIEPNLEIDGKYLQSLVNSKKSPKKTDDESRKSRKKERKSRKSAHHSSSFRHRRYRDENSDDDTNTIVRSSIAKKPLMRVPSMTHKSLDNSSPSIFLQGSLDSINVDAPKTGTGIRLFEINSKKSKSYESIKRTDAPRLSLAKVEQPNVVSPSDSTSKLITANDFDLPTEEFCSVCYLPNDPSSTEIFYTNGSSPEADDDSTKCDICSWNLDIPEQSVPDSTTYETCEICGEPAASFDNPEQIKEKSLSLSLNRLSLRLDEGEEENGEGENGEAEKRGLSLLESGDLAMFVPKDEIAMGKSGKKFSRKGSLAKKASKVQEKRRYASVDNLQYTKYSFKIPGDKLIECKESKYMASADNIRCPRSFRSRSLRRSADNIVRYDSSGDNLDSLDENLDKDEGEVQGDTTSKLKSDTIKMILTQHGIKIISGKETVL